MNIDYTLWPNTDGNLGNIKVQIPDGVNTFWPEGDAIVGNFVYKDGLLSGFVDTKALIVNESKSTTIDYDYFDIELPFTEGEIAITRGPRSKYFNVRYNPINDDNVVITLKYKGCKTLDDIKAVDPNYLTNDIIDGVWSEGLGDLTYGTRMFYNCTRLASFSSDLSSLTDGANMFQYCSQLTSFDSELPNLTYGDSMFHSCKNLTSFDFDLPSLMSADSMFQDCPQLTSFDSDLSKLTIGNWMFFDCPNLTTFTSDLPNLTYGQRMFQDCPQLTTFTSDLPNLTYGQRMFQDCPQLTTFTSDLPNLTNGYEMFHYCENLSEFNTDLPKLTDGSNMFNGCSQLTSFSSDLPKLTDGSNMFNGCSQLTTFNSNLSSLTNGQMMFDDCKLDAPSVKNIIDTINTYSGKLTLGIGCNNTTEDKDIFAQEVGYTDMTSLLATLKATGWTVEAQYNGRPTTTYGLRRPSEETLPVFVKLEEVEETEKHANYTSMDNSKKFRLNWFHETTGSTEGHTQFNTLEEAIETLNIKPIERYKINKIC